MELFIASLLGAIAAAVTIAIAWRLRSGKMKAMAEADQMRIRELEKQIHLTERDHLAARNRSALRQEQEIRDATSKAFEEGRVRGRDELAVEHASRLQSLALELRSNFELEKTKALEEAKERLRSEFELQSKLFTVKISPYVKVSDKKFPVLSEHETLIGYQYQLLVNGIPAFAPHIVIERTERRKEINDEVQRLLINLATQAAEGAIQLYLGGAPQFARLGTALFEDRRPAAKALA